MEQQIERSQPSGSDHAEEVTKHLPTEMWEQIFLRLRAPDQLLPIRLVCRHWRDIFDNCPQLTSRMTLHFWSDLLLDHSKEPVFLFPARKIEFTELTILYLAHWWPPVGDRLISMRLDSCAFSFRTLYGMLRETPNLRYFSLIRGTCLDFPRDLLVDFRLEHLERLTLEWSDNFCLSNMANVFQQICPRLKHFGYTTPMHGDELAVIELIKHAQETLESIDFEESSSRATLMEMSTFQKLNLKAVNIPWNELDPQVLVKFFRSQPMIEDLKIYASRETLQAIVAVLPELRCLDAELVNTEDDFTNPIPFYITYLNDLPALRQLSLRVPEFANRLIDLSTCRLPNLTKLSLYKIQPTEHSLRKLFESSANLRQLTLESCYLPSWAEIFTSSHLKFLHTLELKETRVSHWDSKVELETLPNLKCLSYQTQECPSDKDAKILKEIFRLCPELERIHLDGEDIDDEIVMALHRQIKHLKRITFFDCKIGSASINYIRENCQELQYIAIEDCRKLTDDCVAPLYSMKGVDIIFKKED